MKDLLGKELKVGDKVLLLEYRACTPRVDQFTKGKVIGFTKCTAKVSTEWHQKTKLFKKYINKTSNYLIKIK